MEHCKKIGGGRTTPLLAAKQWEIFTQEVDLGGQTTIIEYNDTSSQWVLTDAKSDVKSCVSSLQELPSPWQTQSGQSQMMTASANFRSTQLRYILKALFKDTLLAYRFAIKFRET